MQPLVSLLYVSQSATDAGDDGTDAAVAARAARNVAAGITGALVVSGHYTAEVLEGDAAAVEAAMEEVRADPRRRVLKVVDVEVIGRRRFARWQLAYAGRSVFVDRQIAPLAEARPGAGEKRMAERLIALMLEFAASNGPPE